MCVCGYDCACVVCCVVCGLGTTVVTAMKTNITVKTGCGGGGGGGCGLAVRCSACVLVLCVDGCVGFRHKDGV